MKKIIFPIMLITMLASCSESIEDRAAREAKEYTEKVCPTPFVNDGRTDSTVFDKNTRTYIYYMTLRNKADNVILIKQNHKKLYDVQKQSLDNNPGLQKYKEPISLSDSSIILLKIQKKFYWTTPLNIKTEKVIDYKLKKTKIKS